MTSLLVNMGGTVNSKGQGQTEVIERFRRRLFRCLRGRPLPRVNAEGATGDAGVDVC
jgi:hypothetical protein